MAMAPLGLRALASRSVIVALHGPALGSDLGCAMPQIIHLWIRRNCSDGPKCRDFIGLYRLLEIWHVARNSYVGMEARSYTPYEAVLHHGGSAEPVILRPRRLAGRMSGPDDQ